MTLVTMRRTSIRTRCGLVTRISATAVPGRAVVASEEPVGLHTDHAPRRFRKPLAHGWNEGSGGTKRASGRGRCEFPPHVRIKVTAVLVGH
jgi:hypothetical protein